MRTLRVSLIVAMVAIVCAGVGAALTDLGPWYYALKQPSWKPPDWLFGPAWTLIYTLTAISAALLYLKAGTHAERRNVILIFGINVALNIGWNFIYFRLKSPSWALVEVGFLWISIAYIIFFAVNRHRLAACLLVPYILWVSFAASLNWATVQLNSRLPA